jgi:hypothetical protein
MSKKAGQACLTAAATSGAWQLEARAALEAMLQQGIPGGAPQDLDGQYAGMYGGGGYGNMMYGNAGMGGYNSYGAGMGYGPMMQPGMGYQDGGAAPGQRSPYGGGVARPAGGGGGSTAPRRDQEFVEGKLFLGGLDNSTTKDTLLEYCRQWCAGCPRTRPPPAAARAPAAAHELTPLRRAGAR